MKIFRLSLLTIATMLVLSGCFSIPLGDGKSMKIGKDGLTFKDEDGAETSITVDKEGQGIKVQSDEEDIDMSVGYGAEIPESFPEDIPLAQDAVIFQSVSSNSGDWIFYRTNTDFDELKDAYQNYYESKFQGDFETSDILNISDELGHFAFNGKTGDLIIQTTISQVKGEQVQVQIIVQYENYD